ncbi:MAG: hypothetical protein M3N30_10065 [Bacteroidota bacterium]|nr:hypothetical protein [Bacteroidota bacterium]
MGNILNEDFRDFISALNDTNVKYILVGGYSVILHGYSRTTGDMDIWVDRTAENYSKLLLAFHQFKMPVFDMTEDNFLHHPDWDVFTFGTPPVAIDLMVKIKGLDFEKSYADSVLFDDGDLKIRTIHKSDLIEAKKSTARPKDLNDLENIE